MKYMTFDDILIVPQFSMIKSRKDVNLEQNLFEINISLPIISSNMDTVTESKMAHAMRDNGGIGCLHRFMTIRENVIMYLESPKETFVSVGVGNEEQDRAKALHEAGAKNFIIDVAHGSQLSVIEMVKWIRDNLGKEIKLVVGNFGSASSLREFLSYLNSDEVDAVKVGIGPGSACTTRIKTGCGMPQLSAIMEIFELLKNENPSIILIADGGMRTSGDIAKALAAGADLCMLGGMFAGTEETPGEVIWPEHRVSEPGYPVKIYRGSASHESYVNQNKDTSSGTRTPEGEAFTVSARGSVSEVLKDIAGGLRSSLCYVGARNLEEFRQKAKFIQVSNNTIIENRAHGNN